MANLNTLRRNGKLTVVLVLVTLLVITVIASYTYLEAMGRITPQFALWVLPTVTSALSYLKSFQAEGKATEATEVQHELAAARALATAALAALPAPVANRIITEQGGVSTVDEQDGNLPGR